MTNKVTVLGSINVDSILQIDRLPKPGETMAMGNKSRAGGGKGANQAVAAARAGAATHFIGKIGKDENGKFMTDIMGESDINLDHVTVDENVGTGEAFILLDKNGENSILVFGGANQVIDDAEIEAAQDEIKSSDFLISQFETPIPATIKAFKFAKENGVTTILNPAPAPVDGIDPELLKYTDLIIPNETESELITGITVNDAPSMVNAAQELTKMGPKAVIITVGSKGAFYYANDNNGFVNAFKVKAKDTTAAGDTFIGALSSQLKTDFSNIQDAIKFANKASSITVQSLGALPSIPSKDQIVSDGDITVYEN